LFILEENIGTSVMQCKKGKLTLLNLEILKGKWRAFDVHPAVKCSLQEQLYCG